MWNRSELRSLLAACTEFVRNFRDLSVLLGSARLCPHSFSPPRLITPLNLTREELVDIDGQSQYSPLCDQCAFSCRNANIEHDGVFTVAGVGTDMAPRTVRLETAIVTAHGGSASVTRVVEVQTSLPNSQSIKSTSQKRWWKSSFNESH
ncbi:hypothetical protein J6590_045344 [Homalodisca vitripennis]|nr:hypothetical protein J6590_045344 [Homalodisca vitripennis]